MSETGVRQAMTALRAAYDALAGCDLGSLTVADTLTLGDELEALTCQLPTQSHRILAHLQAESGPKALGAKSWNEVLRIRWRLSTADAGRRLAEAAALGPRRTLIGQPLPPQFAATAAAQARGAINAEHVSVIRDAIKHLPNFIDFVTREQFETDLAGLAAGVGPRELKNHAERTLFLLDQDGPEPNEAERHRKRGLNVGKQGRDAMVPISGDLTPEAWAIYEAIFAKWAGRGMCNPTDPEPCVSGTPTQAQLDADHRSVAQRRHDALIAIGRHALESGVLGTHHGLPHTVIIRTSLQDLESRAGVGVTGGGTILPIADVIRMAAHANHYLAVFDHANGSALDLFRSKRIASPAQWIMLVARDGGCTKPCCTVPVYGTQVHHAAKDWVAGGNTNVDELGLACGTDNRMVEEGGWTTRMNERHEVEWTHPLDTGQPRINHYHRPEELLPPPTEPPPAEPPAPHPDPKPCEPRAVDDPGHSNEPGGPAPPDDP